MLLRNVVFYFMVSKSNCSAPGRGRRVGRIPNGTSIFQFFNFSIFQFFFFIPLYIRNTTINAAKASNT